MHAIIFTKSKRDTLEVNKLFNLQNPMHLTFSVGSIKDVRDITEFTKNGFAKETVLTLEDIDIAQHEAQNALLKLLEEPPINTFFVIYVESLNGILPTIVSRCVIMEKGGSDAENIDVSEFMDGDLGTRFTIVGKIKEKSAALTFLKSIMTNPNPKFISEAYKTYRAISQNGNIHLQLTNFVISIS